MSRSYNSNFFAKLSGGNPQKKVSAIHRLNCLVVQSGQILNMVNVKTSCQSVQGKIISEQEEKFIFDIFFFLSYVYPICIGVTFKILWNNFIFLSQFWPTRNDFLRVQNRKKNDITNQEVFLKYIHTQSEYIRKTGKRYQGKRVLQQTYKKRTSGQN